MLIVDDDPVDLATYASQFVTCADWRFAIETADSPASAMASIARAKPDCIVLADALRETTGTEFIAEIRRFGYDIPIVVIVGGPSETVAVDVMKSGAQDYLRKAHLTAAGLCRAVIIQLSPQAMRDEIAMYRAREQSNADALSRALGRMSFLAQTDKFFSVTRDLRSIVDLAVAHALPFLGEAGILDVMEDDRLTRRTIAVDAAPRLQSARSRLVWVAPERTTGSGVAKAMRDDAGLYLCGAAFAAAARGDADIAILADAGIRAGVFLPLRINGPAMGVLTILTTRAAGFSIEERLLLDDYAQRVAVAIANARVVESERIQRERAEAAKLRLMFQSRISTLFARSLDWENAMRTLMTLITAEFADSAAIFAVENRPKRIRLISADSRTPDLRAKIADYFAGNPPLDTDRIGPGRVIRTGRSQFFSPEFLDIDVEPRAWRHRRNLLATWLPVSSICVPLQVNGKTIGAIIFVRDRSLKPFTKEDLVIAEDVARRAAVYMEIARLYDSEHAIAATLQEALLPGILPSVTDVQFGVRYFAGTEGTDVGGDWYDIIEIDENRMVITIGDVIGRGIKAAVMMGQYRDYLRSYAFERYSPAVTLARLNEMVNALRNEAFATCIVIVLDRSKRRIAYASAGHPPPMMRFADGTVAVLDGAASMPIGAWPDTEYGETACDMPAGATLVLYTDGLVETRRRGASEGIDLLRIVLARGPANVELMLDGILRELAPDRSDDVAILVIEMLPAQSATLRRWVFPRIDRAVMRTIRAEFDEILEAQGSDPTDIYNARLILGELLANIVRYAPGPFRLELDWNDEFPELRLSDSGPGFSLDEGLASPDDSLSLSGRGLFIIAQLSRKFVMSRRAAGGLASTVILPVQRRSEQRELSLR